MFGAVGVSFVAVYVYVTVVLVSTSWWLSTARSGGLGYGSNGRCLIGSSAEK